MYFNYYEVVVGSRPGVGAEWQPNQQSQTDNFKKKKPPCWWLHLIVVRRFEYASDPESYTRGSVATGRASLAGQVKG